MAKTRVDGRRRRAGRRDLQIGDTLRVWWQPGRDTIIKIEDHKDKLETVFERCGSARVLRFALLESGMTAENDHLFELI